MKVLVTGVAGFIGMHVAKHLLERGDTVIGIDNLNDYYNPLLKKARLEQLTPHEKFKFYAADIADAALLNEIFETHQPTKVVNLAAQAGVRYSLTNPQAYIHSNIVGFANILEACRHHAVEHLVYASSSSVYGANTTMPFSVDQNVDHPVSLYAATKKSNELMAHAYSHLYGIPSTGLRFFTVYGPWGRPDMSPWLFSEAIMADRPITVFNHGQMQRDFTYIDDITSGTVRVLDCPPRAGSGHPSGHTSNAPYKVYNIGNNQPVELMTFIKTLEGALGKTAEKKFMPMQPGDVLATYADITDLQNDIGFAPSTDLQAGLNKWAEWYTTHPDLTLSE